MTSVPQSVQRTLLPVGAGTTDVGRRRDHNEDQILISPEIGVFAVADGMGGHQAGDVASAIAAASLEEFFWSDGEINPSIEGIDGLPHGARQLMAAIHHCNEEVFSHSGRSANQGGMGSTVVAIHCSTEEQAVHICHVGDSRCYRLREGELELLTEDHSMINEALRLNPDLSEDILKQLPSNVVTRALGTKESVRPDISTEALVEGDIYLLCSDGLTGEVEDDDLLAAMLEAGDDPQRCSEMLVAMANEAGGRDNVSAVIVRIEDAENVVPVSGRDSQNLIVIESEPAAAKRPDDDEAELAIEGYEDAGDFDEEGSFDEGPTIESGEEHPPLAWDDDDETRTLDRPLTELAPVGPPIDIGIYEDAVELAKQLHPTKTDDVGVMPVIGLGPKMAAEPESLPRRCRACHHRLLPEEVFCGMCGAKTEVAEDPDMARCDACDHEVLLGTTYCIECGVLHGF